MTAWRTVEAADFEGRRKPIARGVGARAIKLNQFDSQPGQAGSEHDERESGQEEIYFALRGSGVRLAHRAACVSSSRHCLRSRSTFAIA